jgi:hypothetical protein
MIILRIKMKNLIIFKELTIFRPKTIVEVEVIAKFVKYCLNCATIFRTQKNETTNKEFAISLVFKKFSYNRPEKFFLIGQNLEFF